MIIEQDEIINIRVVYKSHPMRRIGLIQNVTDVSDDVEHVEIDLKGAKQLIKVLQEFVDENN